MAEPSDATTKVTTSCSSAHFHGDLRYSKSQNRVYVRARWPKTPTGSYMLTSAYAAAVATNFAVVLQCEFKRSNGSLYWVNVATMFVNNQSSCAGDCSAKYNPDTITDGGGARTGNFRIQLKTGTFHTQRAATACNNKTFTSTAVKLK